MYAWDYPSAAIADVLLLQLLNTCKTSHGLESNLGHTISTCKRRRLTFISVRRSLSKACGPSQAKSCPREGVALRQQLQAEPLCPDPHVLPVPTHRHVFCTVIERLQGTETGCMAGYESHTVCAWTHSHFTTQQQCQAPWPQAFKTFRQVHPCLQLNTDFTLQAPGIMQPYIEADKAASAQTQTAATTEAFGAWALTQNAMGSPETGCKNSMCNDVETLLDKEDLELAEVRLHLLFTHTHWLVHVECVSY